MIDMQNKEIAILSQRLTRLTAQLNSSQQLELQLEMEQLNKRIAQLIKGHASEKRPAASSSAASAKPSQTGHGPKPQLTLETIPVKVSHDELDLQCPQCGKQLEPTNLAPDASFLLSYIPGRFVMKRVERCKYRGTCCGHLDQPTAPAELSPSARCPLRLVLAAQSLAWRRPAWLSCLPPIIVDSLRARAGNGVAVLGPGGEDDARFLSYGRVQSARQTIP